MTSSTDFETTLAAARAGSEWAWRSLYRDAAPVVLRYLRSRGAPDPEDIMGDVFVLVVRKLDQFSGSEDDFRGWVVTIAHHRLIDDARRRARRPVNASQVTDEILGAIKGPGDTEREALDRLTSRELQQVIGALSPDQQDVVFLRMIAGLSINEVAVALGKKPGAVKTLQARAIAALRRNLPEGVSL